MESLKSTDGIVRSFLFLLLLLTGFEERAMGNLLDSDMAIKGYDTVAYFKIVSRIFRTFFQVTRSGFPSP